MIKDIKEVNFPSYATLSTATVSLSDMGERVITAQVKIDGDIVPDFSFDWIIEFKGERYIHPVRKPQAAKENTSRYSTIDLTFKHWAEHEMSRYYFVEMTSVGSGTAIADKYIASLSLSLGRFVDALNRVLDYYYNGRIIAQLNPEWQYAQEPTTINISYTYIWDLLIKVYENYGVHWQLVADPTDGNKCIIKVGYPTTELDHIFEYGFKGGLLKVERQVQSDDIRNILLGRGGEKNIPYRYFKDVNTDNPTFKADPDWIPELRNIYFAELRDASFRSYVQGWKAKHYNGSTTKETAYVGWAWEKGYTDSKFDPVEIVKDDTSIAKYGELWGGLESNEEIFPTIQGITVDPYGRIDQIVDAEEALSDEPDEIKSDATQSYIDVNLAARAYNIPKGGYCTLKFNIPGTFKVPEGKYGDLSVDSISYTSSFSIDGRVYDGFIIPRPQTQKLTVFSVATGAELSSVGIPEGEYRAEYSIEVQNGSNSTLTINSVLKRLLLSVSSISEDATNTFDIWVKNIWGTAKNAGESDADYADRVWTPILGDRSGNTAKIVFSTGLLSISEDYEFEIANIAKNPQYDTSKTFIEKDEDGNIIGSYPSEWKITLIKSEAELDATGLLLPNTQINAKAGDYFFFTGIDMPHQYVLWAEQRLYDYKRDQLAQVSDIKPTWVVSLDKVRIANKQAEETETLLSQLVLGASLRLTDARFIQDSNVYETLYLQSITYSYKESSPSESALIPDVEVVLSDSYTTTANPISVLQGEVSALAKQVGAISNIDQIVRNVGDKTYLRKDGISDVSHSPTRFERQIVAAKGIVSPDFITGDIGFQVDDAGNAELLSVVIRGLLRSPSFVDGLLGSGWRLWLDENGISHLAVDRLTVRQSMRALELLVEKVRSVGGQMIVSAASGIIKDVETDATGQNYLLTFETECQFIAGDLIRCSVMSGDARKSYWVEVSSVDGGVAVIAISEFDGALPAAGDECVLMGNTTDVRRQGLISISATDDGQPRIDVMNGVNGKTLAGALHARLGSLDGIADSWFPADDQPRGYGLYADNAYLRGRFLLTTGEDVKTKFEITEGKIESVAEGLRQDFATDKGYLNNPSFGEGLSKWDTENHTTFFLVGNKWIWANESVLSKKGDSASIVKDADRTVVRIRNMYIMQRHEHIRVIPQMPVTSSGQKRAIPVYLTFLYRCATAGTIRVRFENTDDTGFEPFEPFDISEQIETSDGYKQYSCSGLWNGTGDFKLSFTGDIYLYMLILTTDRVESLASRYKTLFEQSERLVKISAAVFDKDGEALKETGLFVKPEGAGLYAQDADGNVALIGVSVEEEDGSGNAVSKIKLTADNIQLEGLVTANGNFKILEDGSIETVHGKFTGEINAQKGTIGGFSISDGRIGSDRSNFSSDDDRDGMLSIYKDFFRVGAANGYVAFSDDVIPASAGGSFHVTGMIVNKWPNDGSQFGYTSTNYGLLIEVSGGTKNYGISSDAPLMAPAFINTQASSVIFGSDTYQLDFSQSSIFFISTGRDAVAVTLPDETQVAQMFSLTELPNNFTAVVTFVVQPRSKTITLKNIYKNDTATDLNLYPGDAVTFAVTKFNGFRYKLINQYDA